MGWWDEGIMGGDTPLDIQGDIEDIVLGKWDGESDRDISAAQLNEHLPAVMDLPNKQSWLRKGEDNWIFFQVVGYNVITTGAKMPKTLRKQVLTACDAEIAFLESGSDEIGWSNPEERVERLKSFREQVKDYRDGVAVEVHNRGLMEKMTSHLEGIVICHSCGHENRQGSKYCNACGKRL
jgi:hypothetical protein